MIKDFLARLNKHNIDVSLSGDNIEISYDGELDPALLEEIKSLKQELVAFLKGLEQSFTEQSEIPVLPEMDGYPLSSPQRRMWILSQFDDANLANNEMGFYRFSGDLNIQALQRAYSKIIERHEILRTVFHHDKSGEIKQFIVAPNPSETLIELVDLTGDASVAETTRAIVKKMVETPFNLAQGPLILAKLLKTSDNEYVFGYVAHHIVSDGWSMEVLIRELLFLYKGYREGKEAELPPLRIQYKDFASWQQQQLSESNTNQHASYWINRFSDELPVLNLTGDRPRPRVRTYNGGKKVITLGAELTANLKNFSRETSATLFMLGLAGVKALLYKYTGQSDLIVGTGLAGRYHTDLEDQIGFYVNTLPIRTKFGKQHAFRELVASVMESTLGAYEHQVYPFDELLENISIEYDVSRNALFDVSVVLQNTNNVTEANQSATLDGLNISGFDGGEMLETSKFDLSFTYEEFDDQLYVTLVYNSDIYSGQLAENILGHLKNILSNAIANPDAQMKDLAYLSPEESRLMLEDFNVAPLQNQSGESVVGLFEKCAEEMPDNTVFIGREKSMTYKELNEQSNLIADFLIKEISVAPGSVVGIRLEDKSREIVATMAVLKAGGVFMPLASDYPAERIEFMLEDSGCAFVIDEEELSRFQMRKSRYSKQNPSTDRQLTDLAYVIYTSGSTGKPKGVMVEHRSLVNMVNWHNETFAITAADRSSLFLNSSFDASLSEIFPYLCIGAGLVEVPAELRLDPSGLAAYFQEQGVTMSALPTRYAEQFMEHEVSSLRYLIVGGEKLQHYQQRNYRIVNQYGPTENTIVTTNYILEDSPDFPIPIGKPISNVETYVLDADMQLLPVGISGELYIGGLGVARGYMNNPELSAERFVAHPFREGQRLYRTGDICRWLPDGNLEYVGRTDDQVKVRGYRIELDEVENAVRSLDEVTLVKVLVSQNDYGDADLVAYYTGTEGDSVAMSTQLRERIPLYMVPQHFLYVEEMPLTPNGKIDKKALLKPELYGDMRGVAYVAPRNDLEERLAVMWSEILGKDRIGINDDFFMLGGNSLKVIRLVSMINKEFELGADIRILFENPTIAQLAEALDIDVWLTKGSDAEGEFIELKI